MSTLTVALSRGAMPRLRTLHASPVGRSAESLHEVTRKRGISLHCITYEADSFWQGKAGLPTTAMGAEISRLEERGCEQRDARAPQDHSKHLTDLLASVGVPADTPDYGVGPGGRTPPPTPSQPI